MPFKIKRFLIIVFASLIVLRGFLFFGLYGVRSTLYFVEKFVDKIRSVSWGLYGLGSTIFIVEKNVEKENAYLFLIKTSKTAGIRVKGGKKQ